MKKILNIPVTDAEYQMLIGVITSERQAGWRPTKDDIRRLIMSGRKPISSAMKQFDAEMDRSYKLHEK